MSDIQKPDDKPVRYDPSNYKWALWVLSLSLAAVLGVMVRACVLGGG